MPFSTGSGWGLVPRVLHPVHGGPSSVGDFGAHWPAVLVAAVSLAVVLLAAVSCEVVLVTAVSLAVVLVAAVSLAAVLVAAMSLAAVLVLVLSAMQVFGDLPVFLCPFSTLDGGAAVFPLLTVLLGEALVVDVFPFSCRALANFLCFLGGGLSVVWLLGTLAALLLGALQKLVTAGTTVPANVVAEVLGWDLERWALGD
ncbi:hypothetical protein NDU88_000579 [Pleurodeles waltl]|uniref:Uncharacterized protein n=1 Tax=Pleurodeles waltl TaxID=8319 RepID=A0AAV7PA36_PLEWA|nr:hypothetical protein NDU88_000579 [Pleurodeles waltl]